jgi:cobalt-zinc-cadmium efflux system protein
MGAMLATRSSGVTDHVVRGVPWALPFVNRARQPAAGSDTVAGMAHVHGARRPGRDRLAVVFAIGVALVVIELVGGILANSLAVLADAGHALTDAIGTGTALVALSIAARPPTPQRSFGFLRLEILAAVGNAVLLLGLAVYLLVEAVQRLWQPVEIATGPMLAVAVLGLVGNLIALAVLRDVRDATMNLRGAYLEVAGDLAGSVAVIVAALVIALTGWTGADLVASAVVAAFIVPRAWTLLRSAIDVLLEATPPGVDLEHVRGHILDAPGVVDCHDLHAWTITSGMPVVSAHVVLAPGADPAAALEALSECLAEDFDIDHSTFQLETADRRRLEVGGHA